MKKNIAFFFLTVFLVISCSTDNKEDEAMNDTAIDLVGTWVLTDLRIDENTNDDDLNFAKQILDNFKSSDCDIVIFTFRGDGTAVSENKVNFIAENINVGAGGLSVDCPSESVTETTTWSLDGDQLTFVDSNMEEEVITVVLEDENTLIIAGEDINADNYTGADGVFTRQ
ncbi:lipocalin family protein [Flagellimonas sp. HMM57]|uniref:lipocalin family protein n=1 Tax=unclassified Flagellimonas TaxID=2644544 RepID=UPI0013CF9BD1|nr:MULTISPECIES: lipocalin family protein [unclassified Flagellimonas]UII77010.1 lipocalin family protein [Flagellimonas sp. HMM57]